MSSEAIAIITASRKCASVRWEEFFFFSLKDGNVGGGAGCPQVPLIKDNLNSPPCSYLFTGACLSSAAGWCNEFHSRTGCPAGRSLQSHNEHSGASIHAPRAAFPQIWRWHMLSTKTPLWRLHLPHQPFGANPIPSDIGCQIQPHMVDGPEARLAWHQSVDVRAAED